MNGKFMVLRWRCGSNRSCNFRRWEELVWEEMKGLVSSVLAKLNSRYGYLSSKQLETRCRNCRVRPIPSISIWSSLTKGCEVYSLNKYRAPTVCQKTVL